MFRQWLTLVIIVLVYIPVAIDATVLHVAAPTLSMTLGASGNELLWIIDIYSLVMAGMVLPMGALGDRIGFKRLLMLGGTLFGLASLAAAFSHTASWLIATRVLLAIGAAMIVPATLAGIRATFCEEKHRNMALGVMGLTARYVPRQAGRRDQPLNLGHAVMLIIAILLLVYSAKTALKGHLSLWVISLTLLTGALLLGLFIRTQLATSRPMIDMRLFTHRIILSGVVMAMTAMITLVGFELLMAQELQFVHGLSPYEAGVFMLPVMVASGFSGPIAGVLVSRLGLRLVATGGMALSALSFYGLAMTDFSTQQWQAWGLMALLGFSAASALLASTSAIMAAAPAEKAAAAGAIETMAYELGAGLGIAIFGLLLSRSFSASIRLPAGLEAQEIARASSSMGEAVQLANCLPPTQGQAILDAARHAFIWSHSVALSSAGSMLLLLAVGMWFSLAKAQRR
ncbi:MFS transporter [Salmonella enterica subsp. enterica serovar Heidelberg]|nr:MFS transporter [Salmonella enterica subsp. enterica serovar Heidelberg]